jgi:DegV family protein with EDD domain
MTIIVADTTCSLPLNLTSQLGIPVVPQSVIFGEQSYWDDSELTTADFLEKLRASPVLPKTAAPPPALYNPIYERAMQGAESVIVVAPSAKVSGTVRSAETARHDFPTADIHVIDTQTIAGCLGTLVLIAHDQARLGRTPDQIVAELNRLIPHCRTYFALDTLEYLQKGGRIGAARALLGELLQIKPILQLKDGEVAPLAQERTKKRAIARLVEITIQQVSGKSDPHLCVMHIDAEEQAQAIRSQLASRLGIENIPVYLLPPAIVTHAGPKALAIGFIAGQ